MPRKALAIETLQGLRAILTPLGKGGMSAPDAVEPSIHAQARARGLSSEKRASLRRPPEPARGGRVPGTSESVSAPPRSASPVPFQVVRSPQVTPLSVGNLDCPLGSPGELLRTAASVTTAEALMRSGFKSSPADSNVQPGGDLPNSVPTRSPHVNKRIRGCGLGQHCPTPDVHGPASRTSVSLSGQWAMTKTAKPLQLKGFSFPRSWKPTPLWPHPRAGFSGFRTPGSSFGGPGGKLGARPAASARPQRVRALPRAHKAPGADVRAPLGAAGPQCRRSRAALPPRPGSQEPGASRQPSSPAARPEPGPRTCPPNLQTCATGSATPGEPAPLPPVSSHG